MNSIEIFKTALQFEEKIRDLYFSAESMVDDDRGKAIFRTLANEEQGHVDFLEYSLDVLRQEGEIDPTKLTSIIPDTSLIETNIEKMKTKIPEKMLGDITNVLYNALTLEMQTTDFYREAYAQAEGSIKAVLAKFVEIEQRHTEVVRIELDHASNTGFWFDFMEVSMEVE